MSVSAPPPPDTADRHVSIRQSIRPRRAWYWVPILVLLLVGVPSGLGLYSGITGLTEGLIRFSAPGELEADLDEPGDYQIFYEYRSTNGRVTTVRSEDPPRLHLVVTHPASRDTVPVSSGVAEFSYDLPGRSGKSIASFEIREPGRYLIQAHSLRTRDFGEPVTLAIGHEKGSATVKTVVGVVGLIAAGIIAVLVFVLILVLRIVNKNRLEREAHQAA